MTTDEILTAILAELKGIRADLAARPAPAQPRSSTSTPSTAGGTPAVIPQPTQIVDNPGDVQVHFGKNNGVALKNLSPRSLEFYASVKEPKLDSSGKPYPPRPIDTTLENAARTLHHRNLGTLTAEPAKPAPQEPTHAKAGAADDSEDVPF